MAQTSIYRRELQRQLVRVAMVRSLITLPSMFLGFWFMAEFVKLRPNSPLAIVPVFGIPLVVCWIVTVTYCRRRPKCPACGGGLWALGTGNFKPRRMRVRDDATECPHCGTPIA